MTTIARTDATFATQGSAMPLMRLFAVAVFALASALLPSEALADKKKQDCLDKSLACHNRCHDAATKKYGTDSKKGPGQAADAAAACGRRTCDHQLKACLAAEKDKAPIVRQQSTRSPTTAPVQPLTPQKITRSPASAPTTPLTSQSVTRSPASAPRQPLTTSPPLRRDGR